MPNENEDFQHRELLFNRELSDLKLAYVQLKDNLDRQNEKLDRLTKEGLIDIETLRKFCEIAELTATTANQAAEVIGNKDLIDATKNTVMAAIKSTVFAKNVSIRRKE